MTSTSPGAATTATEEPTDDDMVTAECIAERTRIMLVPGSELLAVQPKMSPGTDTGLFFTVDHPTDGQLRCNLRFQPRDDSQAGMQIRLGIGAWAYTPAHAQALIKMAGRAFGADRVSFEYGTHEPEKVMAVIILTATVGGQLFG